MNNSHTNEKTRGSTENTIKRQISNILDTAPTHATEKEEEKGFAQKNINSNNTSAIGKIRIFYTNVLLM